MAAFVERHQKQIRGALGCWVCRGNGTLSFRRRRIRIFDYTKFVEPLRDEIRERAYSHR